MVSGACSAARAGGGSTRTPQGSPEAVADAHTPAGGPPVGVHHGPVLRSGSSGGHHGHRDHRGVCQAGVCRDLRRASEDKVSAVLASSRRPRARSRSGRLSPAAADALLGAGVDGREALADVDLVVEAIAEDLEVKQDLFRDLDRICRPGAILATTTPSLLIIDCAKVT